MEWAAYNPVRKKVNELIPYERNPRIHPQTQIDQLAGSIREWGWTMPILIDADDNVIAGHGRLYAAQQLGIEEVPCVTATDWPEEKKKAYVIADNKLSENGSWDDGLFFAELRSLQDSGFDLSKVGMDSDFAFEDFEPNLAPMTNFTEFTESDVERAANKIDQQFFNASEDVSAQGLEVICPYCSSTFRVTGT